MTTQIKEQETTAIRIGTVKNASELGIGSQRNIQSHGGKSPTHCTSPSFVQVPAKGQVHTQQGNFLTECEDYDLGIATLMES